MGHSAQRSATRDHRPLRSWPRWRRARVVYQYRYVECSLFLSTSQPSINVARVVLYSSSSPKIRSISYRIGVGVCSRRCERRRPLPWNGVSTRRCDEDEDDEEEEEEEEEEEKDGNGGPIDGGAIDTLAFFRLPLSPGKGVPFCRFFFDDDDRVRTVRTGLISSLGLANDADEDERLRVGYGVDRPRPDAARVDSMPSLLTSLSLKGDTRGASMPRFGVYEKFVASSLARIDVVSPPPPAAPAAAGWGVDPIRAAPSDEPRIRRTDRRTGVSTWFIEPLHNRSRSAFVARTRSSE